MKMLNHLLGRLATLLLIVLFSVTTAWAGQFTITINVNGPGQVIPSQTSASAGEVITLTVLPDEGYQMQYIKACYWIPMGDNDISGSIREDATELNKINETTYTLPIKANTEVEVAFILKREDTGKTAYALYLDNDILYFTNTEDSLAEGDAYAGSTIRYLWSGVDVTDSPQEKNHLPKWNEQYEMDFEVKGVIIDSSFQEVQPTSLNQWFATAYDNDMMFIEGLQYLNTSLVTTMYGMFMGRNNLTELDVSHFDTSNVTSMSCMFTRCKNLQSLDVSNFETGNVTTMSLMFSDCYNLVSLDVSSFDTHNVTNMAGMFRDCKNLATVNVTNFDLSSVVTMPRMFSGCTKLTTLDVTGWNTSSVRTMQELFAYCSKLKTIDVSHFDVSSLRNVAYMFYDCKRLETIFCNDAWDIVTTSKMFYNCVQLSGAVEWNEAEIGGEMANPDTGYFTYNIGDIDGDGHLTFIDVKKLVLMLLAGERATSKSDINRDGQLSIVDVTMLVNKIRKG